MSIIVKNTTLISLFDLLAPHSCRGCGAIGEPLCNRCKNYIILHNSNFCPICKIKTPSGQCQNCKDLPPIFIVGERSGLLDEIIHEYKYSSTKALSFKLANLLDSCLPKNLPENTVIVPLPTATNHIRSRGFDHILRLAKQLANIRHYRVKRLLIRTSNTTQVGSSRKARLSQADHAFSVDPKFSIDKNLTYILLDDVWTTGASMKAAIKKLQQAGVSRIVVALLAVSRLD